MDLSWCCDPELDLNCTVMLECCLPLFQSNRHLYSLGIENFVKAKEQTNKAMVRVTIIIVAGKLAWRAIN